MIFVSGFVIIAILYLLQSE